MRQLRVLALLAPALLLAVACESSSSPSATPFTFEAGPGFEAGPPAEAGPLEDGGVDAADVFVPPAPKGVTVTVVDGLTPKAAVRVILQDATGAVIGDAKTDATGKLTIATAPSIVTVLSTKGPSPSAVSYFGVADGDNLLVQTAVPGNPLPIGQYSVTFTPPAVAPIPNANVTAGGSCLGTTTDTSAPVVVPLSASCVGAANAVLADGSDINGARLGYAFKKGLATPAANATDGVVLGAWTVPGTTTLSATNRPAGTTILNGDLYAVTNGAAFSFNGIGSLDGAGLVFATPTGFADAYQSFVRATQFSNLSISRTSFIRREATTAPAAANLTAFDFGTSLPYITATSVDTTVAARPSVTLTSGALTTADGGAVVLAWFSTSADTTAYWTFVLPASAAATFKAPALPADTAAADFTPVGAVSVENAAFFEATLVPGYKETKALPIAPRSPIDLLGGAVPLPAVGTVRVTSWAPNSG
jgi:hypothetical protein